MELQELLDYIIIDFGNYMVLRVGHIGLLIVLLIAAQILIWLANRYLFHPNFERLGTSSKRRKSLPLLFRRVCYILAFIVVIQVIRMEANSPTNLDRIDTLGLFIERILVATAVLLSFQLLIWLINRVYLERYFERKEVDVGRRYTVSRLIMYVGYVIAIFSILSVLNFPMQWLVGSSAALLVGVGLGLQQTFNDLISGIIILIEGTVEVGDIVVVDGFVAKVRQIGLRTSKVETRDYSIIIIPNSKLVVENVDNWSHDHTTTARFQVNVGVSYSSDIQLVTKLLLQAANEHEKVMEYPKASVQFVEFGNSSLDFKLHFFCKDFFGIEFVKSAIRFRIMELFREHAIEIPFPQRDLWLRNPEDIQTGNNKK